MKTLRLALLALTFPTLLFAKPPSTGNEISQARNKGQRGVEMRSERAAVKARGPRKVVPAAAPVEKKRLQRLRLSNMDLPKRGR